MNSEDAFFETFYRREELGERPKKRSSAQTARQRMIRRQTAGKLTDEPSGTSKIPLWSNYR